MPPKDAKCCQSREIKFGAGGIGKGFNGFAEVASSSKMGLEVKNAEIGFALAVRLEQHRGKVDHEESEIDGVGDSLLRDIHKILQSPILFGIAEVELNLEA